MGAERAQSGEHRRGDDQDRPVSLDVPEVSAVWSADDAASERDVQSAGVQWQDELREHDGPSWAGLDGLYASIGRMAGKLTMTLLPQQPVLESSCRHVFQRDEISLTWTCLSCGIDRPEERMPTA